MRSVGQKISGSASHTACLTPSRPLSVQNLTTHLTAAVLCKHRSRQWKSSTARFCCHTPQSMSSVRSAEKACTERLPLLTFGDFWITAAVAWAVLSCDRDLDGVSSDQHPSPNRQYCTPPPFLELPIFEAHMYIHAYMCVWCVCMYMFYCCPTSSNFGVFFSL